MLEIQTGFKILILVVYENAIEPMKLYMKMLLNLWSR